VKFLIWGSSTEKDVAFFFQYQPFGFANIVDVHSVPRGTNQLIRINGRKHGGPNGAVLLQKLNHGLCQKIKSL